MEDLFNMLSSSARFDKSKKKKKKRQTTQQTLEEDKSSTTAGAAKPQQNDIHNDNDSKHDETTTTILPSRDRTGKRDTSLAKQQQVHREAMAAFRRSVGIRIAHVTSNDNNDGIPDPISSFAELPRPNWWSSAESFDHMVRPLWRNVEAGRWREPTPIQMQAISALMARRDLIGAAATGSGKSGAFLIPALLLSRAPHHVFYGGQSLEESPPTKQPKHKQQPAASSTSSQQQGSIRALVLAPSLELASQLFREVERLSVGMKAKALLLSKANASHLIAAAGGPRGLDVLVATPLRLVDCIHKGLKLGHVRLAVLDEVDRLLDAADGGGKKKERRSKQDQKKKKGSDDSQLSDTEEEEEEGDDTAATSAAASSGSSHTQTFLAQMDVILNELPVTAVRALFSATVTPTVRSLAESILRNPVDVTIVPRNGGGKSGGVVANTDIDQKLVFVSNEQGKLLALRQLVHEGKLRPPAICFLQSQERAQALFEELLYDNLHVDVIHAGRSKAAREKAVSKFRKGDTWVLICTDLVARGVDFRAVHMVINYDMPTSGIVYTHRIGRTGRAGRKGTALTLFTEADFEHLRTIANVMKQSGCHVEEWMLNMKKPSRQHSKNQHHHISRGHDSIDTTSYFDKKQKRRKDQIIRQSKAKKARTAANKDSTKADNNNKE